MPTVPVTVREYTTITVNDDETDFELAHMPIDNEVLIEKLPSGITVIGYLSRDSDCDNPLEDDEGMGMIHDRRNGGETESIAREALGMDDDGNATGRGSPYAVLLDVYSHSGDVWRVHGGGVAFVDEQWDVSHGAGVWVPNPCCVEHIASTAVLALLPTGTKIEYKSVLNVGGTVFMSPGTNEPDPKFFNSITYTLPDGRTRSGYKTFETAARAAARALKIKLDKASLKTAARKVAVECATQAVKTYNTWLAGEVYGVCVEVFSADGTQLSEDACWGYLCEEYAMETLAGQVAYHCKKHSPGETS